MSPARRTLRTAALVARKDLRLLARSRRDAAGVAGVAALGVVIPALILGPAAGASTGGGPATAALWTAVLLGSVVAFERTIRLEHEGGAVDALRLSGADPAGLFLGKLASNLALVTLVGAVAGGLAAVLMNAGPGPAPVTAWAGAALALLGVGAIGTLVSAGLPAAGLRPEVVAMAVLPLAVPLVLLSARLGDAGGGRSAADGAGLLALAGADAMYLGLGWLAYGPALEG